MKKRFENKIALITGGSSGMGRTTAKLFVEEGATVIVTGLDEKGLADTARELGVTAIRSDASKVSDIESLMAEIKSKFGRLDIIFANAGIAKFAPLLGITEQMYDAVMGANLKGVFFLIQKAEPLLGKGASIVLNASIAAQMGGTTIYGASKAGVRALGRSLARELVPKGIRVNVVSPGSIDTPIYTRDGGSPNLLKAMSEGVPMKRPGTPEEVAHAVAFLASDESSYILGVDLLVDGGTVEV